MSEQTPQRTTLTINWLQIAGGAGAAVTSAVLLAGLKSLGPYGTLVGAAVGSVIASTAAAVYGHYLNASRQRIAEAARRARERRTGPVPPAQDEHPDRAEPPVPDPAADPAADPAGGVPAPQPPRRKRFRPVHAVALGVVAFVLSVGGIFVYESVSGQSVAAERQGTTDPVSSTIIGTEVTTTPPAPTPSETATPTDTATASDTATDTSTATDTATSTGSATADSTGTATGSSDATSSGSSSSASSGSATGGAAAQQEDDAAASPTSDSSDGAVAQPSAAATTAPAGD